MNIQIDREQISSLKNDTQALLSFFQNQNDSAIIHVLKKFGRLENQYSKKPLLDLLNDNNEMIRLLAVKNLAKMGDISLLETFSDMAWNDGSTDVRRESAAAIGRIKDKKTISVLIKILADKDPKVVLQGIRGLFTFSDDKRVRKALLKMQNHPNELIKEVVACKLNGKSRAESSKDRHADFPEYMRDKIVHGDVMETLGYVPNESIHLTFTSPPYYNARDYSIYQSYSEYLSFLEEVFMEVHRVTKEGRFFVLNTSPIIIPRVSRAHASKRYPIPYDIHPLLCKMGWEFIDDIIWVKPEASVKNRNAGFMQHRKPLAYKPNAISEMLMVYRKKTEKLIDWNMRQYPEERVEGSKVMDDYETTNVWCIDPTFDRTHSAVFPMELCTRVIKYYSYIDDLVFDPFAGSGTLGRAAACLGRHFFLTEKELKYVDLMSRGIRESIFDSEESKLQFLDVKSFAKLRSQHDY